MIVRTVSIDGNQRYSWTKNQRSWFVSRTRPCSPRLKTINCCRSTAFSASSRNFDLNGEARTARAKQSSPIIPPAQLIPSRHKLGQGFRYTLAPLFELCCLLPEKIAERRHSRVGFARGPIEQVECELATIRKR